MLQLMTHSGVQPRCFRQHLLVLSVMMAFTEHPESTVFRTQAAVKSHSDVIDLMGQGYQEHLSFVICWVLN